MLQELGAACPASAATLLRTLRSHGLLRAVRTPAAPAGGVLGRCFAPRGAEEQEQRGGRCYFARGDWHAGWEAPPAPGVRPPAKPCA
jgi:hypothetical protein